MPHLDPTVLHSLTVLLTMINLALVTAAARYNRRQAHVLAVLRTHDAWSHGAARSLEALGIARDAAYRALVRGGVVIEVAGERAYLSTVGLAAAERRQSRRRALFWVAAPAIPLLSMAIAPLWFGR